MCGKTGHLKNDCWHKGDPNFKKPAPKAAPGRGGKGKGKDGKGKKGKKGLRALEDGTVVDDSLQQDGEQGSLELCVGSQA